MSVDLFLHGRKLGSVFELVGSSENSITYSLGWTLARAPALMDVFLGSIGLHGREFEEVRLQEYGEDRGYTDIELLGPETHVIVEAKRGWWLPHDLQWQRYAPRFDQEGRTHRLFVAMSDCTREYAALHLPTEHSGVPLRYLGWRDVVTHAGSVRGSHAERRLMLELSSYLGTVATMQDIDSNWVFVVSLGGGAPEGASISWVDIVEERQQYFHTVGKRWPKEPPNYFGFRYGGRLQCIRHVDSYVVTRNLHEQVPEMPNVERDDAHFVYSLGPAIRPPREVKAGPRIQRSARVWAMIDLLLTCETVTEAMEKSKEREQATKGKVPL